MKILITNKAIFRKKPLNDINKEKVPLDVMFQMRSEGTLTRDITIGNFMKGLK